MLKLLPEALRGIFRSPATRPYPGLPREPFPGARGEPVNDISACILCGTCARVCPTRCLDVDKEAGRWMWDPMACIYCGSCVEACPTGSLTQSVHRRPPTGQRESVVLQGLPGGPAKKKKPKAEG